MISLNRIRELEPKLANASDEEVAVIREYLYGLGQLFYETWEQDTGSKFPVGSVEIDESK